MVFTSRTNEDRARIREGPSSPSPVRFDPEGPFAPEEGRVRTLAELISVLSDPADPPAPIGDGDSLLAGERIAIVSSLPTHYRIPLFNSVAARLEEAGAVFKTIFLAHGRADRDGWMRLGATSFDYEVTRSAFPVVKEVGRRIPLDILPRLRHFQPTMVVSGGLSLPVSGRIGRWASRNDVIFGVWSGETSVTAGQRGRVRTAGRARVARAASFALAYGSASDEYLQMLKPGLPVVEVRNSTPVRDGLRPTAAPRPSTNPLRRPGVSGERPRRAGRGAWPPPGSRVLIDADRRRARAPTAP